MKLRQTLEILLSLAVSLSAASAQVATGNIRGTIADASSAVIANCSVTVTSLRTGLQRAIATNDSGDFNAPSLPVGEYQVSAEVAGFQKKTVTGIVLQVDQTVTLSISLIPAPSPKTGASLRLPSRRPRTWVQRAKADSGAERAMRSATASTRDPAS